MEVEDDSAESIIMSDAAVVEVLESIASVASGCVGVGLKTRHLFNGVSSHRTSVAIHFTGE